jgi:hypothetical protein
MSKAHSLQHLRDIVLTAALCTIASPPSRGLGQAPVRIVVAAKTSVVRAKPSLEAKAVVGADGGTEFSVTGSSAGWFKVALKTGGEGWIPGAEVGLKVRRNGQACVELGLNEAIKLGAIEGEFRGTGASSGDAITFKGKGTLKLSICPRLEPGSILENASGSAQNMVVASVRGLTAGTRMRVATELTFEPEIESEYVLKAYCVNFEKDNPSEADRLQISGVASPDIVRVVALGSPNIVATQLAIWAITDDVGMADVVAKFNATTVDVSAARALMLRAALDPTRYRLFR